MYFKVETMDSKRLPTFSKLVQVVGRSQRRVAMPKGASCYSEDPVAVAVTTGELIV